MVLLLNLALRSTILVFQDTSDEGDAIDQEEESQAFVELDDEGEEVEIDDEW